MQDLWANDNDALVAETAAIKILGDLMAQPCYRLEGDSFLLPFAIEEVMSVSASLREFMAHGLLPKKAYNQEDYEVVVVDPDDDEPRNKGCIVDFLRFCGKSANVQPCPNKRMSKFAEG